MKLYKYKNKPALPLLIFILTLLPLLNKEFIKADQQSLTKSSAILAFPFWLWAIFNTINGKKDLGVVSFGSVILSFLKCNGFLNKRPNYKLCKNILVFSSFLVTLNYALALTIVNDNTPYYMFATVLWFSITLLFLYNDR